MLWGCQPFHFPLFLPQNIQSLFISMQGKQYVEILIINMLSCSRLASKIMDMWQFRIEIKYYFVAYFEHITEFDTLLHWAAAKGGAQARCVKHEYLIRLWSAYKPRPQQKLSTIPHQTHWCAQNKWWNNVRFLSGTAKYLCFLQKWIMNEKLRVTVTFFGVLATVLCSTHLLAEV